MRSAKQAALLFFKDEISEFFQSMILDMKNGRGSSRVHLGS